MEIYKFESGHTWVHSSVSASGLYWTGICYHPIPKGWHGLREGFGDPHLPPLTMRSFSAMSSSSSFLRCSKCTSMSVCSSSRSFSMRFRWMSCRTEGGSPVIPRSGPFPAGNNSFDNLLNFQQMAAKYRVLTLLSCRRNSKSQNGTPFPSLHEGTLRGSSCTWGRDICHLHRSPHVPLPGSLGGSMEVQDG